MLPWPAACISYGLYFWLNIGSNEERRKTVNSCSVASRFLSKTKQKRRLAVRLTGFKVPRASSRNTSWWNQAFRTPPDHGNGVGSRAVVCVQALGQWCAQLATSVWRLERGESWTDILLCPHKVCSVCPNSSWELPNVTITTLVHFHTAWKTDVIKHLCVWNNLWATSPFLYWGLSLRQEDD